MKNLLLVIILFSSQNFANAGLYTWDCSFFLPATTHKTHLEVVRLNMKGETNYVAVYWMFNSYNKKISRDVKAQYYRGGSLARITTDESFKALARHFKFSLQNIHSVTRFNMKDDNGGQLFTYYRVRQKNKRTSSSFVKVNIIKPGFAKCENKQFF